MSSPLTANVAMPLCSQSAAATSSWVDSGFDAQSATSAPPAASVSIRFAVSVVTCRHAPMRTPASGCSFSNRSRISASTGISPAAHSMRSRPFGASARSLTSHPIDQAPSCPLASIRGSRSTSSLPTAFAVSFETRTTSSWLTGSPNAFVTHRQTQHAHVERPSGNHLRHHGHAHDRGAGLPISRISAGVS